MTPPGTPPRRGRKKKGASLAAALTGCAGVGGELEQTARRILLALACRHRFASDAAAELGISDRQLRRLFAEYGTTWQWSVADLAAIEPKSAAA